MNRYTLTQLRNVSDELSFLAGTFQLKPFYLRAKQIRQADKTLASVESLFSSILALESSRWKEAADGLAVLRKKLLLLEENEKHVIDLDHKIDMLKTKIAAWSALDESERKLLIQIGTRSQKFIDSQDEKTEANILHRYYRFSALKELIPYTENANHLCETIYHYENKKKYEFNVSVLNQNIDKLTNRTKTVHRGFWFAILLCAFLVTIPICVPFAISLWRRKGQIKDQIKENEELLKKESKRLLGSQEGAVVAQKIKRILGDVSLEQIRNTLFEMKELKTEFQGPEINPNSVASLLNFIDLKRVQLEDLFGEIPEDPLKTFRWLSENVTRYQEIEVMIVQLIEKKKETIAKQKQLTKGYSSEMLKKSMQKLQTVVSTTMDVPFELENKMFFADLCSQIPDLLTKMRENLYFLSKGQSIDLNQWNALKLKIQGFANMMSLCILDAEIVNQFQEEDFNHEMGSGKSGKSENISEQINTASDSAFHVVALSGAAVDTGGKSYEQSDL